MNLKIKKRDNSPDFVIGSFGFKYADIKPYVNAKGYVNCDILQGKDDSMYIKVSNYGLNNIDKPFN